MRIYYVFIHKRMNVFNTLKQTPVKGQDYTYVCECVCV